MKLLLDQGLPRTSVALLKDKGAVHVGEIGYAKADDIDILEFARSEDRVVVTLDADFHAILALSEAITPSVIRIRIEGLRAPELCSILQKIIEDWDDILRNGVVMSVQPGRIRLRNLPL